MGTNGNVPQETAYDMASMRIENTWWEVKQSLLRTGTSKDLFKSYLRRGMVMASALWRRSFWKHYQAHRRLYEVRRDA